MSDIHLRKAVIRLAHQKPEFRAHLLPLLKEAANSWATVKVKSTDYRWRKNDLFKKNPHTQAALDIEYQPGGGKFGWKPVKNLQTRSEVFEKATGKKPGKYAAMDPKFKKVKEELGLSDREWNKYVDGFLSDLKKKKDKAQRK